MKVGTVLKIFRIINNISIKEVAEKIGGTFPFVSSVEANRYKLTGDNVKRFAKIYGVECGQIFYISEQSEKNNWSYAKTVQESVIEWLKKNDYQIVSFDENIDVNRFQIGNTLKACRLVREKEFADMKEKTSTRISEVEKGKITLSFDLLLILSDVYNIPASKIVEIYEQSVNGMWSFQRILYEVAVICQDKY